jgi:hypothetical protein
MAIGAFLQAHDAGKPPHRPDRGTDNTSFSGSDLRKRG